ncbi:MAG: molybdenum cofactor biosynthesis protein MoaE [Cytophagales bacterium]|nr:MAG: molybdenum cofactor biosynthesis protein MoaE [Cytophagales bacterium]TAF60797.1 MAG: molybdenum cofactor biosynthesis protein MoaE [Cytophagales bacterium]
MSLFNLRISSEPLSLQAAFEFVESPSAGGLNFFVGTVRNQTQGKAVQKLHYEAYEPMALKELEAIALELSKRYFLFRLFVWHRVGTLQPSEAAVIIGVSTAHRAEAFAACKDCIELLKSRVPIWKKEFFEDGAVWVSALP